MRLTSGHLFGLPLAQVNPGYEGSGDCGEPRPVILDVPDESLRGKTVLLKYQGAGLAATRLQPVRRELPLPILHTRTAQVCPQISLTLCKAVTPPHQASIICLFHVHITRQAQHRPARVKPC